MNKKYDLEERTFRFAKAVIEYVNFLKKTLANVEISKQLIRSSGSVGANYIEANESLKKILFIGLSFVERRLRNLRFGLNYCKIRILAVKKDNISFRNQSSLLKFLQYPKKFDQ